MAMTFVGPTSAGATTDQLITAADISPNSAVDPSPEYLKTGGGTKWLGDNNGGHGTAGSSGSFAVTTDDFDGRSAIKMMVHGTTESQAIFKSYGPDAYPKDVPALLAGASFSYTGADVNFQLGMFFHPKAAQPGCTPDPKSAPCFTIIKFDPFTQMVGTKKYATITLGDAGWLNTQQVGTFPKGTVQSATLDLHLLLAQMSDYVVYGVGASVGSGSPAADSWLLNMTFGGVSYSFGTAPKADAPAVPPAIDSTALEAVITTKAINVVADTANFAPVGAGTTPITLDPTKLLTRAYRAWTDPTDAFVDVYAYSPATFIGTFPVVNGNVVLTNAKLPALAIGAHQLLFQGQTSHTLAVVAFTVLAPVVAASTPAASTAATAAATAGVTPTTPGSATPSLPSTGTHTGQLLAVAGLLLLVGGGAVVIGRPRRSRQH